MNVRRHTYRRRRRRGGFTLMELMIVVTIIGLLAAIAIPAYSRARTKSQTEVCKYNMRLIFDNLNIYCLETCDPLDTGRFPNLCAARDALCPVGAPASSCFIKDRRVFSCPGNPNQAVQHDYAYLTSGGTITGLRCNIVPAQHN